MSSSIISKLPYRALITYYRILEIYRWATTPFIRAYKDIEALRGKPYWLKHAEDRAQEEITPNEKILRENIAEAMMPGVRTDGYHQKADGSSPEMIQVWWATKILVDDKGRQWCNAIAEKAKKLFPNEHLEILIVTEWHCKALVLIKFPLKQEEAATEIDFEEEWRACDLALRIAGRVEDIIHEFVPESLIPDACTITNPGYVEVFWEPQAATSEERILWAKTVAEKVRKALPGEEIELDVDPNEYDPACVVLHINPKEPAKFLERIMAPIEALAS